MNQLYCSLDFETTGLNTQKDDPIQIGLLIFDETKTIHASYSSLIKPSKSLTELKEIVQYVTGFEISHLQYAPSPKEVFAQVAEYIINKNLIFIGHNVAFDLAILQRFLPQRTPQASIDTFDCARQLLHFQQSYALDAIIHLDQQQQLGIFTTIQGKAHDALYDATASMQLFLRWYGQTKKLASKYPVLKLLLVKNKISAHIAGKSCIVNPESCILHLPPLQSYTSGNTKIILPIPDTGQSLTHNNPLKNIIQSVANLQSSIHDPIILSVNHPSKISILKVLLQQQAITAHDSVHDLPKLNELNAKRFLQTSHFSRPEIGFLIKYFSQFDKGHTLIDCKSVDDYKILNAITDLQVNRLEKITLCTHQHLRSFKHKIEETTHIYFFDSDHWLGSYLHSLQQPIDLLHITNLADQLAYRYTIEENISLQKACASIVTQLCIFSSYFHHQIGKYFSNTQATTIECSALSDDYSERKALRLLHELQAYIEDYRNELSLLQQGVAFLGQRNHCCEVIKEPFVAEKKIYNDSWYLLFHAPAYHVTHEDFMESLPKAEYTRIKSKEQRDKKSEINKSLSDSVNNSSDIIPLDQNFQSLNALLNQGKNIFLLCQSKQHSKGLFEWMIQQKVDNRYTILAENITGGTGKALLFAKKSKKPILMIGSENYYYSAIGGSIAFKTLGLWYYKKENIDLLKSDLTFYTI